MRIRDYRNQFIATMTTLYDAIEAESFFYLALEHYHGLRRIDLALKPELEFTASELENWKQISEQLEKEIPIQYIIGITSFYGLDFEVDQNVLIPRPETEELVDWILIDLKTMNFPNPKMLDIGTGSGCIAISLAKNFPEAEVSAIDVSQNALSLARENSVRNQVAVNFIHQDILKTEDLKETFEVIVSNPPYVRNLEKAEIKKNVLQHEPHLALFVEDDDALVFYKKIAELAQKNLASGGWLYFEINQYLGKEMIGLLTSMDFESVQLRQDIYGNDRMIRARKK